MYRASERVTLTDKLKSSTDWKFGWRKQRKKKQTRKFSCKLEAGKVFISM